jgi:DNA end-binding protein Ku
MPKAIWSGSISFGLVNIPIKIFPAVRVKQVRFHLLHEKDKVRLKQKLVCPADHKEVERTEAVKGYEISPDEMVVVKPEELEKFLPKASRTIELLDFVKLDQIDSIFFNQPYYVVPEERAEKPYRLFLEAMERSKKVGIANFVMRNKQYLCALRPLVNMICLETMYYADELIKRDSIEGVPGDKIKVSDREVKMAEELIESLTTGFKPEKYHDDYREAVQELMEKKAEGKDVVAQSAPTKKPQVIDLMSALKASLDETKKKKKKKVA